MEFGIGEFSKNQLSAFRNEFFLMVQREASHVIKNMQVELYPLYVNAFPKHNAQSYASIRSQNSQEAQVFHNALVEWSKHNNLHKEWAMDRLVFILSTWKIKQGIIHILPGNEANDDTHKSIPLLAELKAWEAWIETEEEFRASVDAYIEETILAYIQAGWERRLVKRDRGGGPLSHLSWLVKNLFVDHTIADIANDYMTADPDGNTEISEDAIRKALRNTREILDL
jgi:hypothetical protein